MNDQGELVLVYTGDRVLEVYEQIRDNGMMSDYDTLLDKIKTKQATVCVIGLGYVGLVLARNLIDAGYRVLGVDQDNSKIEAIAHGKTYLFHLDPNTVKGMKDTLRFIATDDMMTSECVPDVFIVCVPTPLKKGGSPDISIVVGAGNDINNYRSAYTKDMKKIRRFPALIVLESSTYPGTTKEVFGHHLESHGFVAYSPERENPGSDLDSRKVTKLVGGLNEESTRLATALYQTMYPVHVCESAEVAEAAKLLENAYRFVNIGFIHEFNDACLAMGLDTHAVINAAKTKPFGFQAFYPSTGVGGHCIGVDPAYWSWKANSVGKDATFIDMAKRQNDRRIREVAYEVFRQSCATGNPKIVVLGLAYKPNLGDMRESASVRLVEFLKESKGLQVFTHDPFVDFPLDFSTLADAIVVLATPHDEYEASIISLWAEKIIDPHGACRHLNSPKVIAV